MAEPEKPSGTGDPRQLRRIMVAGLIGSSIEWYDFFIYATAAALVFGPLFFPDATALTATLLSFSTFWAGFIARPIGGLVFAHFGDKAGRKPALVTCLALMGAATFLIGVLPTAASVGALAPVLLVLLRFLQGIAVGGQWGGVVLLLTENASRGRRGMAGTFGQMGVPVGVVLGNGAFLVGGISGDQFLEWGWRLPFLLSAVLFPVVLYIQLRIEDTPVYRELRRAAEQNASAVVQAPLRVAIVTHYRQILLGAGLLFATNAIFYISIAGVLDYGTRDLGLERTPLLATALGASVVGIVVIFLSGWLSDRVGRRPLLFAGAGLVAVWAFPFFWLIDTGSLLFIWVALTVGGIGSSLTYGPLAAVLSEIFEPRVRYSGATLAYQIAAIAISGGTPFIMTALLAVTGTSAAVSAYILVTGLVTIGCAWALKESRNNTLLRA